MRRFLLFGVVFGLFVTAFFRIPASAQNYARGQDISPTFDGWQRNADGTFTFYYGYYNRNSQQAVDVPVGPDNTLDVGGDRGQPTHFYPSRRWWVFKVVVPADWPKDRRLVWTLTTFGKTNQAKAWLQPEWEVDDDLISKNGERDPFLMTNGPGDRDTDPDNIPPTITIADVPPARVSEPITLAATATDDARPKVIPDPSGRLEQGIRVRWILHRGPGTVTISPDAMPAGVNAKTATLTSKAQFSAPGAYQLRAIASDGQAFTTRDITVTVR